MKKILLLIISVSMFNSSYSQNYLDSTSTWSETDYRYPQGWCYYAWFNYRLSITGDTVIFNKTYKKIQQIGTDSIIFCDNGIDSVILGTYNNYYGAIREEAGKFYVAGSTSFSERLLYDFTLNVGDSTISHCKITSIDTVYLGKTPRKKFILNNNPFFYYIEGIGHNFGLFEGSACWLYLKKSKSSSVNFICYKQGNDIYQNNTDIDCDIITNNKNQSFKTNRTYVIYPNPTMYKLHIEFQIEQINGKIELYNQYGQTMISKKIETENTTILNIENLAKGLYFIRVIDKEGVIINIEKLIKN